MARLQQTWWQGNKYLLNALILVLPCIYIYQALNPTFPELWQEHTVGEFKIAPMPLNMEQPYSHHNEYVKDFFLAFNQGEISNIRQAYLNIGPYPLPLTELAKGDEGIMHGTNHGQHAHAIAPSGISKDDKLWITIQTWQGEELIQHWAIPNQLIP
ncbi:MULTISPECIES: hypothetical protein [Pseudoalteromonas]|uniref:hypothetical protein n=1 Tax=Pseudoalteromonas TaxID=53246 RepID=UPI0002E4BC5C|nr:MULTISPECIES: hypothetical protein [Pseudoalteromonas]MCF6144737.1 hypothetical protein [Pseudoalteromonas mariniglutinosa NCIMB 1770]